MGKHRKMGSTCKKFAALGAAAISTTALTVAVIPDSEADNSRDELLRLLADIRPFGTNPQAIPDLTGGFGTTVYDFSQDGAAQLLALTGGDSDAAETPGLNIVTTGPLFALLSLFGVDYGRVPALPGSIADEINQTPYLDPSFAGIGSLLKPDQEAAAKLALKGILIAAGMGPIAANDEVNRIFGPVSNIGDVRIIPVIGVGLGAFAAGAAYQQVVDDLPNQPGGANSDVTAPGLGSFTVLPMVLLLNPGRANGGLFARAFPFFRLFGIDTVTPETEVSSSGGDPIKIGDIDTGLALHGANLIPIKLDIGIQNFPASDFAAWPNPVTLANNGAALLFPTYIIRGFDEDAVEDSLEDQLEHQLPGVLPTADKPLSFNFYLTVPINGAPVLEPTYLPFDVINLVTGGEFNNPIGTALNPVLESAGNLGYTDVERVQNSDGDWEYVRTFDDTNVPTAFGSFPDVDWEKVPGDLFNLLGVGLRQAIDDGITGEPGPNALAELLKLLGLDTSSASGGSGLGLSSLSDLSDGLVGNALGSALQTESIETASFSPPPVDSTQTGSGSTVQLNQTNSTVPTAAKEAGETPVPRKQSVAEIFERLGNSVSTPKATAATGTSASRPNAALGDAVKQASDGVKKTVESVNDGLKNAVSDVQNAVKDTAKKMSDAAKPNEKAADAAS